MSEASVDQALQSSPFEQHKAPHWHSREVLGHVSAMMGVALLPILAASVCLFGTRSLTLLCVSVGSAALCEALVRWMLNRNIDLRNGQTVVMAALLALTFPPQTSVSVVAVGGVLMVVFKELVGGLGHYLWHPMLLSRALLAALIPAAVAPDAWPVLKKDHVVVGQVSISEPSRTNSGWLTCEGRPDVHAWHDTRPVEDLARIYRPPRGQVIPAEQAVLMLTRDELPPVLDCVLGTTGGGLGEVSVLAALLGGFFLIHRGYVRWTLPAGVLTGVVIMAAMLPVPAGGSSANVPWWPALLYVPGHPSLPVGMMLVLYHLVVGELAFATFFVASDMSSSPMRKAGHWWFGLGIGALTVAMRFMGFVPGDTYWAILIMNTLVPLIDRFTRRRVYGT